MERIHFTDDMILGVPAMDNQHRKLIDMINDLIAASQTGCDRQGLARVLAAMNDYIDVHFEDEEDRMEEFDYPGVVAHQKQHKIFVEKVQDFSAGFHAGDDCLPAQMLEFLACWLIEHIKGEDPLYVTCFKANGM